MLLDGPVKLLQKYNKSRSSVVFFNGRNHPDDLPLHYLLQRINIGTFDITKYVLFCHPVSCFILLQRLLLYEVIQNTLHVIAVSVTETNNDRKAGK